MAANVLFDAPGPNTRRRHLVYSVVFVVVILSALTWVGFKLKSAGQFEPRIFEDLFASNILKALFDGMLNTLKAAALAIVLSVVLGFLLAVGRLSDHRLVAVPCRWVIEFFRAVPLLLLIILIFGLLGGRGMETSTRGLISLVGGLMLYNGAVLAEVFRAGIGAVPKGQSEAAYAIGMRKTQVMNIVLVPQAVRIMLPTIISQCVVVLKDTSLGFIVAYGELLRETRLVAQFVNNNLWPYLLAALMYIVLNSIVSAVATYAQKRSAGRGSKSDTPAAVEGAGMETGRAGAAAV
ncbi:MAG: amino acid ABC transporter permease [Marmoricola sp.]